MIPRFFTPILGLWLALFSLAQAAPETDWIPQINFRPAAALQSIIMGRPAEEDGGIWHFQKIEAGTGPLYTDFFGFTITRFPKAAGREMKPSELLQWSRSHLGDFLDPKLATTQVDGFDDEWRWESNASASGAVVQFNFNSGTSPGPACLAVTDQSSTFWVLSSVHASAKGVNDWPVNGNRWIGLMETKSHETREEAPAFAKPRGDKKTADKKPPVKPHYVFYTRGAWRVSAGISANQAPAVVKQEESLWKGYIERFQAFIIAQGGECAPVPQPVGCFPQEWEKVRDSSFAPYVPWADPEGSWTSTDPKGRFRLVIHPGFKTCDFIERAKEGKELSRSATMQPAGEGGGWKIERSSVDPDVLDFLGFDSTAAAQIIAAAPGPSYMTITRKGPVLKARWHGFIVERDGKGAVAAIKAPGAFKPKEYDLAPTKPSTAGPAAPAAPPAPDVPAPPPPSGSPLQRVADPAR
jgi:hypothetical protein